jgi:hypothetical protein
MTARVRRNRFRWPHLLAALALMAAPMLGPPPAHAAPVTGGPHDFDFEFGDWRCHLKRRLHPLTGSSEWVEYDGSSIVRRVWGGKANLGEIDLSGPAGRIQGLSLRTYNPDAKQWSVVFANAAAGQPGVPMVGGFRDGRGEFYDQETLNGRAIFVRFIFSDITPTAFRLEQAFSDDGGKSWEANWIATFTKVGGG